MTGTSLFGVVGNPVKHSLSPRIHQFWYDQLSVDARYVPLELAETSPAADIQALARAGFSGLNVTLPHKGAATAAAGTRSNAVDAIGAANTLVRRTDKSGQLVWHAENTDHSGFLWSLESAGIKVPERALIIGAGGAARAVVFGLMKAGIDLEICNRTLSSAEDMRDHLNCPDMGIFALDELERLAGNHSLVVNTISLGHSGGLLPLPEGSGRQFVDISYGKAAEGMLSQAKSKGWNTLDGLPMLVGQAADAFELWFDQSPDRESVLKACREWTGTTA